MIFWSDKPVAQWIYVKQEPFHLHPWCAMVGESVRARCTTESEASKIVVALQDAFLRATTEEPARVFRSMAEVDAALFPERVCADCGNETEYIGKQRWRCNQNHCPTIYQRGPAPTPKRSDG